MKKAFLLFSFTILTFSLLAQNKITTKSFRYFLNSVKPKLSSSDKPCAIYGIDNSFKDGKIRIYTKATFEGDVKGIRKDGTVYSMINSRDDYRGATHVGEIILGENLDTLGYNENLVSDEQTQEILKMANKKEGGDKNKFILGKIEKNSGYKGSNELNLPLGPTSIEELYPSIIQSPLKWEPTPLLYFDYTGTMSGFRMKQIASFPVIQQYVRNGYSSFEKKVSIPKKEENLKILNQLQRCDLTPIYSQSKKDFHGLLRYNDPEDKFSIYRDYYFVRIGLEGAVTVQDSVNFDFIRDPKFSQIVINTKGEETGILYVFKEANYPMAGKKQKDPVKNTFDIVFIGLDGKVKFNYKVLNGEDEFGMNPVSVFEKNGIIYMHNLRKPAWDQPGIPEILSFSNKEMKTIKELPLPKMSNYEKTALIERQKFLQGFSSYPIIKTVILGEEVIVLRQYMSEIVTTNPNTGEETSRREEYSGIVAFSINPNLEAINEYIFPLNVSSLPANLDIIRDEPNNPLLLVTTQKENLFIHQKDGKLVRTIPNIKGETKPISSFMNKNYLVDKEKKKIYFFYDGSEFNTGVVSVFGY